MTEEEINRKAREIYTRCFDDVGEYVGVINALVIAVRETSRELEAQIEKMKNWCNCKNYQQCLIELAEQGKGMYPSECCCNCKKWEIKEK